MLIELMIVAAILGIPDAMAFLKFSAHGLRGHNTAAKTDTENSYMATLAPFKNSHSATAMSVFHAYL